METSSKLSDEAKRYWKINLTIHEWMKPDTAGEIVDQYHLSLDAMAKAEAMVAKDLDLLIRYTRKVYYLLFDGRYIIQPDRNFALITAPAHIRAKALAEIIQEMKNGEHR